MPETLLSAPPPDLQAAMTKTKGGSPAAVQLHLQEPQVRRKPGGAPPGRTCTGAAAAGGGAPPSIPPGTPSRSLREGRKGDKEGVGGLKGGGGSPPRPQPWGGHRGGGPEPRRTPRPAIKRRDPAALGSAAPAAPPSPRVCQPPPAVPGAPGGWQRCPGAMPGWRKSLALCLQRMQEDGESGRGEEEGWGCSRLLLAVILFYFGGGARGAPQ